MQMSFGKARVWEETVTIPTYGVGTPNKNPMFLEKRVYQGSSGRVYPHPVTDKIFDEKADKAYRAIFLENDFIRVMLLPEIGGRIQRAYDKIGGQDFVYYNHVIKPALVGLAGPWISGGIEFNWPQHHRPSTFDPVDYTCFENADGSATAVMGEIETMFRTKSTVRFTLYPDRAYIEIAAQLYNRTPLPQTFLWWANPAVAVNDNTRTIFPPDVTAVMDHGKRAVSTFPIATGTYYKVDYSAGVDISRYKNLPVPTSYMAAKSDYDFVGGYDDGTNEGVLHVADHHVAPGKKQWTWGCGDFGKAWDRNLTDSDGPYVELMTGCFTDNQPDFSWLMPQEEKRFTQYFMPYRVIGTVHNATKDLAMNFEDGAVHLYASGDLGALTVTALAGDAEVLRETCTLLPTESAAFPVENAEAVTEVRILRGERVYLSYEINGKKQPVPEAAVAAPAPKDCATTEDLYLYGLHVEQYRHATRSPEDYYLEGLRRDSTDIRLNNAYGRLLLMRGQFRESEAYFRAAVNKATRSNPNPYDSEPYYNLGLALLYQGRLSESYDALYKSVWSDACKEAAFYHMACICTRWGDTEKALEHLEASLDKNRRNTLSRNLKALLLQSAGRSDEARALAAETVQIDPLDFLSRRVLGEAPAMRTDTCIEVALEYAAGGFYADAAAVLCEDQSGHPMVQYHLARIYGALGQAEKQKRALLAAQNADSYLCFPHRTEDMLALEAARTQNPTDGMAAYYLGCLYYDKKRYDEAIRAWQTCTQLCPDFPTAYRNLALAYYNKRADAPAARTALEKAFALDKSDARVLFELDCLYQKIGEIPQARLHFLEQHLPLVQERDDLYTAYITLLNQTGRCDDALECLLTHRFHPWEGGEGKAPAQYVAALCRKAAKRLEAGDAKAAIECLDNTFTYPENLGEGKLYGAQENLQNYLLGEAYRLLGEKAKAESYYKKASAGLSVPQSAVYYNDQPPESIFCQGLALRQLGEEEQACARFRSLADFADAHEHDEVQIDYFAVSLPDFLVFDADLHLQNRVHCLFMRGLGQLGLGERENAILSFSAARALDNSHAGLTLYTDLFTKRDFV